jgi:bud site selection protein 20
MGKPQKRKKKTAMDKNTHKQVKLKHYARDLDQIADDIKPENAEKLKSQAKDEELPGQGQYYCIQCARYFINSQSLADHIKSKPHKKRLKQIKDTPYTQQEAERAAGMTKSARESSSMKLDS